MYMTPFGEMAGVELIAQAIESDLQKHHIYTARWWKLLAADLIVGSWIVLVYFLLRDSPGIALLVSTLSIFLLFLPAAWAFYSLATWLNIAPVMTGMLIHQMYESTQLSRELREKLKGAKKEIRNLRHVLKGTKIREEEALRRATEFYLETERLSSVVEELREEVRRQDRTG